ncbi:MAG: cephalosporin hydroxylase family protein [Desulfomonile tiedjei]|nr:cephalosporin hydroxylase family protein [Desulfomonile tiedjei]
MPDEEANDPQNIAAMAGDERLRQVRMEIYRSMVIYKYSYNFTWFGRPIIQCPQDIVAMQEIIWNVKPDLIVETGIAHGGSLVFYASLLEAIGGAGEVVGVDIEIRDHNRKAIETHSMAKRIRMIEGSSVADRAVEQVYEAAAGKERVLVALDSNHTHEHVLKELTLYSPLVTEGSYLVVFDTIIEDLPDGLFPDRPWSKGNNPKTAVREFLKTNDRFAVDRDLETKLLFTVAPEGYLKCIKE